MDNGINQDLPRISLLTVRVGPKRKKAGKESLKLNEKQELLLLGFRKASLNDIAWKELRGYVLTTPIERQPLSPTRSVNFTAAFL